MNGTQDPLIRRMLERQEESLAEVRETLAAMQQRLETLAGALDKISGDNGMPRCARHDERISELVRSLDELAERSGSGSHCVRHTERIGCVERKLDTLSHRLWWFSGSVGLAFFSLGLKMLFEALG
jgi:hypothetical protein